MIQRVFAYGWKKDAMFLRPPERGGGWGGGGDGFLGS